MKEFLFRIKKSLVAAGKNVSRLIQRRLYAKQTLSLNDSFNVPVIINNRNRLTYLQNLVSWLQLAGYKNIVILDNDSTYPPLLDYYDQTRVNVLFLKRNAGYKALWTTGFFSHVKKEFYVYTDPDLMPGDNCPKDVVYKLYLQLMKHNVGKCGPALKVDDLPDHYKHKIKVIESEGKYWEKSFEKDVYQAPIDTTFALYKPYAQGDAEDCSAIRIGGDLVFRHMPWYENSAEPDEETKFYINNASDSTFWYKKVNN